MKTTIRTILAVLALGAVGAACVPPAPPAAYSTADGWRAIDEAFADHGAIVVATFHCIAGRESGHNGAARNGRYLGLLQIDSTNAGYQGSLEAAAVTLGRPADWFDPYVNARTGRIIYDYRLSHPDPRVRATPLGPWSTAPGC